MGGSKRRGTHVRGRAMGMTETTVWFMALSELWGTSLAKNCPNPPLFSSTSPKVISLHLLGANQIKLHFH